MSQHKEISEQLDRLVRDGEAIRIGAELLARGEDAAVDLEEKLKKQARSSKKASKGKKQLAKNPRAGR